MDINRVILQGMVGTDLELRTTKTGKAVTNFRMVTTAHFRNEEGVLEEYVQWHSVVAWEDQAELAVANLKKGSQVHLEGSLRTRQYDQEYTDGKKSMMITLYATEVVARIIQPIGFHQVGNGKETSVPATA